MFGTLVVNNSSTNIAHYGIIKTFQTKLFSDISKKARTYPQHTFLKCINTRKFFQIEKATFVSNIFQINYFAKLIIIPIIIGT